MCKEEHFLAAFPFVRALWNKGYLNAPQFFIFVVQMCSANCIKRSSHNLLMWDYRSWLQNKAIYSRPEWVFKDIKSFQEKEVSLMLNASISTSFETAFGSLLNCIHGFAARWLHLWALVHNWFHLFEIIPESRGYLWMQFSVLLMLPPLQEPIASDSLERVAENASSSLPCEHVDARFAYLKWCSSPCNFINIYLFMNLYVWLQSCMRPFLQRKF